MEQDDGENIFLTQNSFQPAESDAEDSDCVVSNFGLILSTMYSDISDFSADNDEDLVIASTNGKFYIKRFKM